VKLLFDQNLSPFLASRLADIFPESVHVLDVGLDRADDAAVWNYARANSFSIVSKDSDFHERSVHRLPHLRGARPGGSRHRYP